MKNRNELAEKSALDVIQQIEQSAVENNISRKEIAQRANLPMSSVYRIFSGASMPSLDNVVLLALAAECNSIIIKDLKYFKS